MIVATVLTVYGIETLMIIWLATGAPLLVATVLTVYGIETLLPSQGWIFHFLVATVLTVYGIETLLLFVIAPAF